MHFLAVFHSCTSSRGHGNSGMWRSAFGRKSYYSILVVLYCVIDLIQFSQSRVFVRQLSDRRIDTGCEKYRGILVEFPNRHLRPIEAYLGIRYASVLGGSLRFMPPTHPPRQCDKEFTCIEHGPVCPQRVPKENELRKQYPRVVVQRIMRILPFLQNQEEDCLMLNLYVPTEVSNKSLASYPVMVFIHGESYSSGSGNAYDGSVLASYGGVIVVTVNYRLGVLGFLSTGDSMAPGNYAILDLMAALHWIRQNIGKFGGDRSQVTLVGHGYGASLVNILLVSPFTRDEPLFHRAILQSGSALSPLVTASPDHAKDCLEQVAIQVDCQKYINNSSALVSCLKTKSSSDLATALPTAPKYHVCLGPVVTPWSGILPRSVRQLHMTHYSALSRIPIMVGANKYEAVRFLKQGDLSKNFTYERKCKLLRTFVHNVFPTQKQRVYEILDHHYTDWSTQISQRSASFRDSMLHLLTDGLYVAPLLKLCNYHADRAATYMYHFGYDHDLENGHHLTGSIHGDELPFVYGAPLVDGVSPFPAVYTKLERMLSEAAMRYWSNFAKSGNPNTPAEQTKTMDDQTHNRFRNLEWPMYTRDGQAYLHIGKRPKVSHHYRGRKVSIWLYLLPKLTRLGTSGDKRLDLLQNGLDFASFDEPEKLVNYRSLKERRRSLARNAPLTTTTAPPGRKRVNNESSTAMDGTYNMFSVARVTSSEFDVHNIIDSSLNKSTSVEEFKDTTSNVVLGMNIFIGIGCSLLLLNVIIFIGILRYRKRLQQQPEEPKLLADEHFETKIENGSQFVVNKLATVENGRSPRLHRPVSNNGSAANSNNQYTRPFTGPKPFVDSLVVLKYR